MPADIVTETKYNSAQYGLHLIISGNGGSAPASVSAYKTSNAQSVTVSKDIPSAIPTRTGHTFLGYAVGSASNAVSKQPGNTMSQTFSRIPTTSTTTTRTVNNITYVTTTWNCRNQAKDYYLYAKWQANTYTVSYNANGGAGAPAAQTKTYGVNLTLSSTVPTRTNYNFKGWATSASATAAAYQPGGTYSTNSAVTLYAVWELAGSTISTITSSVAIGSSGTASWNILNAAFTYKLVITCGSAPSVTVDVAANTSSCTFTIPSSWLNAITNAASATATATLTTYNNGSAMGSNSKTFTVTVPSDVVPTISSFTAAHYSANATVAGWDEFTQGYSKADLSVSATPGTGASIASISFNGPEINQTGPSATARTGILNTSGTKTFTVTVTDSRGRSASDTVSVTVYPYSTPTVIAINTMRADADGTTNNSSGAYLKVMPIYSLSSVNGHNSFASQSLAYGDHGSQTPTATITCASGTTYGPPDNMWAINLSDSYDVAVNIVDALGGEATGYVTLPGAAGIWYGRTNDRLGLGEAPPGPGFHCSWDATFNRTVDITPRRCSATLSSAGWYRVIEYDAASSAEVAGDIAFAVDIWLFDWARQYNKITLYGILNSSSLPIGFGDETSKCAFSYLHFDKIRYTRNGSTGYVDVHYNLANTRMMACWFSVKSTWSTGPSIADMQKRFKAIGFTAVADSPAGETVLTTYDFVLNTDDSATVSVGSDANDIVVSGTKLYKHGKIVTGFVKVNTKSISAGAWRNMAVIPSGFRPPNDIDFAGINNSDDTFVHARIFSSSGNISIWPTSAIASGKYIYISFTYYTDE